MTGLEKILNEIQKSALVEVEVITKEAREEADRILEENRKKVEIRTNAIYENAKKDALGIISRSTSNIELQIRQEELAEKQRIIKDTIEEAKSAIAGLDSSEYLKILSNLAKGVNLKGETTLQLNARDKEKLSNEILAIFPDTLKISLDDKPANIIGGFLLFNDKITVNCSIEAIFDNNYDQIVDKVQKVLFE